MGSDRWVLKTFALLHDPPHKPLVLGRGHAEVGAKNAREITGAPEIEPQKAIEESDRIASGADRAEFLRDLQVDPRRELTLIHPMDGTALAREKDGVLKFAEITLSEKDVDNARSTVEGPGFVGAFAAVSDPRLRYFLLWRFQTEVLRHLEGGGKDRFGALWDVLPADTRMPNHPVSVHCSLVSALAPILAEGQEPALMRFAIGPVQHFIEAARSLADLWAGSYLLSRAVFEAMKVVFGEHGPDSILYPLLGWQPLFDVWLADEVGSTKLPDPLGKVVEKARARAENYGLRIPSLPNLFVAVVPAGQGPKLAGQCEDAVRHYLRKTAEEVIRSAWSDPDEETVIRRALRQWYDLPEIHWAEVAWPQITGVVEWLSSEDAWPRTVADGVRGALQKIGQLPGYRPNAGALYPLISEQSALLLDAAKRDRLGGKSPSEEGGLKCSVCGAMEVLGGTDFYEQRDLWREMAGDRQRYPFAKERDSLCGVCLVKRLVGRRGPEGGTNWRHPSTSEVATSRLKLDMIRESARNERLKERIYDLERAAEQLPDRDEKRVFAVPSVIRAAGDDGVLKEFARLDGEVLLPISRSDEKGLPDEFKSARNRLLKEVVEHLDVRPSPYLAVVVFDGDEVGKWLSGEKAPFLLDMLHPNAMAQIGQAASNLDGLKRPVTPAIHAAMSQICSSFAQFAAPWTIEQEGLPGHLVYAGGDDVLFLAPPLDALRLVWRLRLRYSGYPESIEEHENPEIPTDVRPWFLTREPRRVVLAFGKDATASAGMCIFHAKAPLGLAVERARGAERAAKETGRNALGIAVLRRSGQESEAVVPFDDTMTDVLNLAAWFARYRVSRSLHVLIEAEFASLHPEAGGSAGDLFTLAAPLVRRVIDRRLVDKDEPREELCQLVVGMAERLLKNRSRQYQNGLRFLRQWADMVSIAEFLARPYDRGEEE